MFTSVYCKHSGLWRRWIGGPVFFLLFFLRGSTGTRGGSTGKNMRVYKLCQILLYSARVYCFCICNARGWRGFFSTGKVIVNPPVPVTVLCIYLDPYPLLSRVAVFTLLYIRVFVSAIVYVFAVFTASYIVFTRVWDALFIAVIVATYMS